MLLADLISSYHYFMITVLMVVGLYGMAVKRNYVKKVIGLTIFQTSIILFYISTAVKSTGGIPILDHHTGHHGVDLAQYSNPLPHVLMLTAIVVGVAILGVAFALVERLYSAFTTLEEDEIESLLEQEG